MILTVNMYVSFHIAYLIALAWKRIALNVHTVRTAYKVGNTVDHYTANRMEITVLKQPLASFNNDVIE